MKNIYNVIYDTGAKMGDIPFSKDAAKTALSSTPARMNLLGSMRLDNMAFVESLYMSLFNRTMDDAARAMWEGKKEMPRSVFQREAVISLLNSDEYQKNARRHVEIVNNVYGNGHRYSAAVKSLGLQFRMKTVPKVKRALKNLLGM